MDAEWSYDRNSGRYRDAKGRFLSKEAVGKIVDGRIGKLETQLKQFTRMLGDGSITLDQWQGSVRESLKAAHIQAATIGYGGRSGMGSAEYGRIGQRLRGEYAYLQGFVRDLIDGRISAPMAVARIGLYAQSVRGSYWQGTEMKEQQRGFSLMRRILDDQAVHCQDCLSLCRSWHCAYWQRAHAWHSLRMWSALQMQRQVFQTTSARSSRVILPLSSGRFRFSYGEDTVLWRCLCANGLWASS
jgi:hypothetical protein